MIGSHLDLAPTILDLAHICADNSFMGHSLLSVVPDKARALAVKHNKFGMDTKDYSMFMPATNQIMLYNREDYGQTNNIVERNTSAAEALKEYILSLHTLVNQGYRQDLYH